jgi:hypothetical protein
MSVTEEIEPYESAATERCVDKDLELPASVAALAPAEQRTRHQLLDAFYQRRSESPIGQETVENLQAAIVAYSLHAGRWRGLTWHERDMAIVWLLAGRYHRSGERDDSYPHFRRLSKTQLLPTEQDYERVFERESVTFAEQVLDDVRALLQRCADSPGTIIEGRISQRIGARAVRDAEGKLQVALDRRLYPGEESVPGEWLMIVLAGFFPSTAFEHVVWRQDLAGASVSSSESVFTAPSEP